MVLPDTTSSTRWVDFDAPYLKQAFTSAGYTSAEFRIDNAQGSDSTQLSDATADINLGAKILIVCPLDGPTGVAIAKLAEQKGVTLIAYDRAIFQGTNTYYVSFNNEQVGELIGKGFNACVKAWGIKSPQVFVLNGGEDTDPNAISFASGYNKVVWGQAAKTVAAGANNSAAAPRWSGRTSPLGGTTPRAAPSSSRSSPLTRRSTPPSRPMTGSPTAVITDLKTAGVKPNTIPTTGQDATAQGMAWVLEGYQCGSVYKAVYKEAQDSVAMATILLAGAKPPAALLNGNDRRPGQLEHHRAGVPADPGVGDQGQHGVDSRGGQVRHGRGDLRDRGCERLRRERDQVIS